MCSLLGVKKSIAKVIYKLMGSKPWSRAYNLTKFDFIERQLANKEICKKFANLETLPDKFGYTLDERVVEYPWTLMRLNDEKTKILDAGSVFNFRELVEHPRLAKKDLTIFTLAPECQAFWDKGISYQFGDLRDIPYKDEYFDEIISLSTLGHVGMNNRIYTNEVEDGTIGLEAEEAVKELLRVLKPGGRLLISVVFGKHQLIECQGAPYAEQFDSALLADMMKVFDGCQKAVTNFYKYTKNGWNVSSEEDASGVEYFNIHVKDKFESDMAAAARAVALIDVTK